MSKYKIGDKFEIEIENIYTDCLDTDFYKLKNIARIKFNNKELNGLKQIKYQTDKYDCSKALEYTHEQARMHNYYKTNGGCCKCPFDTVTICDCEIPNFQEKVDVLQE